MKATVFLGGGRITSALVAGLRFAEYGPPIVVHDRHPEKLRKLKRQYGIIVEPDLHRAVESAHVLIVAVRPDSVRGLLKQIRTRNIRRRLTAVSLAAGVTLAKLRAGLGPPVRWARAMPSPVCRTGQGLTALTFERGLSKVAWAEVRDLFALVGTVLEIPERRFDAFTVTYSSSHGYHALAALIKAAEDVGLDRKSAHVAAAHALADGITAWRAGNLPVKELLQEAATPGGIAATVMSSLDAAGYEKIIARGLYAGIRQAKKNNKRVTNSLLGR
ncbi:MAG TPA: NAD(P)-binding domain-containing protein [Candidatus Acidoferrum sp.]|nr:NAD(P)-binding domain-containing protein [Candidatus Acidoferrum sp.]